MCNAFNQIKFCDEVKHSVRNSVVPQALTLNYNFTEEAESLILNHEATLVGVMHERDSAVILNLCQRVKPRQTCVYSRANSFSSFLMV